MQVSEAQRLRELDSENAKLKRLLAEAHLDRHAPKSVLGVKRYPRRLSEKRLGAGERSPAVRAMRVPACGAFPRQLSEGGAHRQGLWHSVPGPEVSGYGQT